MVIVGNRLAQELERGLEDILARGGCVFPICSHSKRPLPVQGEKIGKPGQGGYKLATNDPRIVWHYFRGDPLPGDMPERGMKLLALWRRTEYPNAAVTLDMSGMLVLDADDLGELEQLVSKYGSLPATYCVRSPRRSGGIHYYFKADPLVFYRRTVEGFPHLDIKHHGYVLIPGSAKRDSDHEVMGRYEVVDGSPIADIPNWLLALIEKPVPVATQPTHANGFANNEWSAALNDWTIHRARIYLTKMPPAISGNGGHNAALAAARVLVRGFALSDEDAYDILASDYNPRCDPPWAEWELRHKIQSARNCLTIPLGYLLSRESRQIEDRDEDCSKAESDFDIKPLWENE